MNFITKSIFLILFCSYFSYQIEAAHAVQTQEATLKQLLLDNWFTAAKQGYVEIIRELIGKVAINAQQLGAHGTALQIASSAGHEEVVKLLLTVPDIDVNAQDGDGNNSLGLAAYWGHENIVKLLLQNPKININIQDRLEGNSPLIDATEQGHANIVKILLQATGIDVNQQSFDGSTALITAVNKGFENIVNMLLTVQGLDINMRAYNSVEKEGNGNTALIEAVIQGRENIVYWLLQERQIKINIQNCEGYTALMLASSEGFENIVNLLLHMADININIRNKDGMTAYMLAVKNNQTACAELIKNKLDELTKNAFQAVTNNNIEVLKTIVAQIGIDVTNKEGIALITHACSVNQPEIIKFLIQNAKDPRELLSKLPSDIISKNATLFQYVLDLALSKPEHAQASRSKKRKKSQSDSDDVLPKVAEAESITCGNCSKPDCQKRCSCCKLVYYCSDECQKAHWKTHKHSCRKSE